MTTEFTSVNIYRVPRERMDAFLRVEREAAAIYRRFGTLEYETLAPMSLVANYGYAAFTDALDSMRCTAKSADCSTLGGSFGESSSE